MLTPRSNTSDLLARLSAVPGAVQASTSAALAAYVRARSSGVSKAAAIRAYAERARPLAPPGRGRGPRREAAWEGEGTSTRDRSRERGPSPYPLPKGERGVAVALAKAAAIQGALDALGRSS